MKTERFIFILLFCCSVNLHAISPYVKGYRLYIRYVKHIPKYGIKAPELLKKLHIRSSQQLHQLIQSGKIVEEVAKFNPNAAKGIEKILKKGKEKELEVFLNEVMKGRIPLGCN
ncbi:hypothetical protein [Caminibacter pacificus]|uniref:Uncharacterized protein n=1 Tax=Caminibacter pacificus TaxID=1424653 RepID=A0AAJ4RCS7_9BACT|nr:hypothetical protein [Caminibacter pacificus]QCI27777.1 hypothetical protein C6V80_01985 [Caminibacter pacificus]ROR40048.1 hypothetical protein EDC58_1031 [Caminibacter pacificus]